jgi:hypothetical protein
VRRERGVTRLFERNEHGKLSNGGGVETAEHPAQDDDEHSPLNAPCMRCGRGPMVVEYVDLKERHDG